MIFLLQIVFLNKSWSSNALQTYSPTMSHCPVDLVEKEILNSSLNSLKEQKPMINSDFLLRDSQILQSTKETAPAELDGMLHKINLGKLWQWIFCFCTINFDLDIGQHIQSIYPPLVLSESERKTM
jgi:hypothetical protein